LLSGIGPSHNGCSEPNCHHYVGTLGEPTADLHYVVRNDSCAGTGCHAASNTNLTTLHPTLSCATCHASTVRQAVKDAITNHNKSCTACHGSGLPTSHTTHTSADTVSSYSGTTYSQSLACSACHGTMELIARHGGSTQCSKCHPSPANPANAGTNFACSQTGCHQTNTGNMQITHATMTTDHTVSATGCTAAGCHQTNLATIHGRHQCTACHAAGKPRPTSNCTATGCHAGYTTTTHLSRHDFCNDCHSGHSGPGGPAIPGYYACSDCHGATPGVPTAFIDYEWHPYDPYTCEPWCH
jgi:hypothetical protein